MSTLLVGQFLEALVSKGYRPVNSETNHEVIGELVDHVIVSVEIDAVKGEARLHLEGNEVLVVRI